MMALAGRGVWYGCAEEAYVDSDRTIVLLGQARPRARAEFFPRPPRGLARSRPADRGRDLAALPLPPDGCAAQAAGASDLDAVAVGEVAASPGLRLCIPRR